MKPWVFITGAAGGIGRALVALFSAHGWQVAGTDILPNYTENIDAYFQADLADPLQIEQIAADFATRTHSLHALINNAAFQVCKSAQDTKLTEWQTIMAVNVQAPFWLTQQFYPLLKAVQGNVVHISSVHALATSANIAAYASSKGALTALTRAQAIDFANDRIRVNAVLPGAVDTAMLEAGLSRGHLHESENIKQMKKQLAAQTVMGKIGLPSEIAEAVYFLADNMKSGFISGQTLVVDGGALARLSTE